MTTPKHACHRSSSSGPVPSHKQDAVVVVDFFATAEVTRYVEDICGKETVLDSSMSSSFPSAPHENNPHICKVDVDQVDQSSSGLSSSFLSQKVSFMLTAQNISSSLFWFAIRSEEVWYSLLMTYWCHISHTGRPASML